MTQIALIAEDAICQAIGERLIGEVLGWTLAISPINCGGVSRLLSQLDRYQTLARLYPVLCIADTDRRCAVELLEKHRPPNLSARFLFRLAVPEIESWILADNKGFAEHFRVPESRLPRNPDEEHDSKLTILHLVQKSKSRLFKNEMISAYDRNKIGTGYNLHLTSFVREKWSVEEAAMRSASLARCVSRLQELLGPG